MAGINSETISGGEMKKPNEVSARITSYLSGGGLFNPECANHFAVRDLLIDARDALDSLKEWPADLTRERLEDLADSWAKHSATGDALRRLAELAPRKEKRKVWLWDRFDGRTMVFAPENDPGRGWRKVGEAEIDA